MSRYDYEKARELMEQDLPFASLIMAAYRRADILNAAILRVGFPEIVEELDVRYDAPGGRLPEESLVHVIVGPHKMLCGASEGIGFNVPFTANVNCSACLQALETGCHVG